MLFKSLKLCVAAFIILIREIRLFVDFVSACVDKFAAHKCSIGYELRQLFTFIPDFCKTVIILVFKFVHINVLWVWSNAEF